MLGAENLVRAVRESGSRIETVIGVSTDKACKPINVMGMTKALMERMLIEANIRGAGTRFACVRYGNVIASRGSVVPLFHEQIANGGPVTITTQGDDPVPAQPRSRRRHRDRRDLTAPGQARSTCRSSRPPASSISPRR